MRRKIARDTALTSVDRLPDNPVGEILRALRRRSGMSQMDLALAADISPRHLGFVEQGRARASQTALCKLLDALESPPADRAAVFVRAGFAVPESCQDDAQRRQSDALLSVARHYAGMPIVTFDHTWTAKALNADGIGLARHLMGRWDWQGVGHAGAGLDMIAATAHAEGLLARAREPDRLAAALLGLFEADRWSDPGMVERVQLCAEALADRYGTALLRRTMDASAPIEMAFDSDEGPVRFGGVQCLMAAPHDVSLRTPRMQLWMPLDDATRHLMAVLQ